MEAVRRQCQEQDVAFFFKQWGVLGARMECAVKSGKTAGYCTVAPGMQCPP